MVDMKADEVSQRKPLGVRVLTHPFVSSRHRADAEDAATPNAGGGRRTPRAGPVRRGRAGRNCDDAERGENGRMTALH